LTLVSGDLSRMVSGTTKAFRFGGNVTVPLGSNQAQAINAGAVDPSTNSLTVVDTHTIIGDL
jgi:hypothetical protein